MLPNRNNDVSSFLTINNFKWSLKPMIIFSKCLGLKVDFTTRSRIVPVVLLLILFFCSICVNVVSVTLGTVNRFMDNNNRSTTPIFVKAVVSCIYVADGLLFITIPLVFTIISLGTRRWKGLWRTLKKIQEEMSLNEQFHHDCRRECVVALSILVLVY